MTFWLALPVLVHIIHLVHSQTTAPLDSDSADDQTIATIDASPPSPCRASGVRGVGAAVRGSDMYER
jgi:hypothetical protein